MSDSSGRDVAPDALAADVAVRYRERLILFAARRLKNRAAAEDAAQETLRRVLDALRQGRVRDLQALPAFTFETARHVCQHMRLPGGEQQQLRRENLGRMTHAT